MAGKPLTAAWCVVAVAKRGDAWTAPSWLGRTRTEAINAYMGVGGVKPYYGWERKQYEREVRRGWVKLVRVHVISAPPAKGGAHG